MSFESSRSTNQGSYCIHEDKPVYWGQTTDPSQHNPDNFRYLVHAFNPHARLSAIFLQSIIQDKETAVKDGQGDQSIDIFREPERIDGRVSLSMSLIDQNHSATWGNSGIIVQAPESSVVLTSPTDAGVLNSYRNHLIGQGQSMGILSPDDILERSSPDRHNEIVALGCSGLRAVGFFYKVNSQKKPIDPDSVGAMCRLGNRMGLPVVEIYKENAYIEDKVVRYTYTNPGCGEELRVFFGGMCYCVPRSNEDLKFCVVDGDTFLASFPSPEKFTAAIDFALSVGEVDKAEAEQILEDYNVVDVRRQTPTAYFDENGDFDRIEYSEGYGSGENRLFLNRYGFAHRVQLSKIMAAIEAGSEVEVGRQLSDYVTDRMVKAAVKNLSPEKAESIRSWYEKVRPSIKGAWSQQNRARSSMGYSIIR